MKQRKHLIIPVLTAVLGLVYIAVMYLTHRYVPFMMDDLWYATLLSEETPIASLGDIIQSQIWHYNYWGGRSMTHGILQLILLAGEGAADILNVAVTLLLAYMIAMAAYLGIFSSMEEEHSTEEKNSGAVLKGCMVFGAAAMLIGLNANWKMSMFWQAGATNYLYITVFILGYLYCYLRELPDAAKSKTASPEKKQLPGIVFWIIPLGILAGWSNENMGPAVWIVSLIVMLILKKEKRRIRPWMVLGSLSCLAGSVVMILAPGNFVRSNQVAEREYGTLWQCFLRGYAESKGLLEFLFPVLLVLGAMLLVSKALKISVGRKNLLLLFCALLSWGAMILSPHYPDRASFGTMTLLICVVLNLAGKIYRERKDMGAALWLFSVLIWARGIYFMGEFLAICWGWIA